MVNIRDDMPKLHDNTKAYVESTLGVSACLEPVKLKVPLCIQDSYKTFELTIPLMNASELTMILLIPANARDYPGIVKLKKHLKQIREATDQVITYVCQDLTPYDRRSLISHQLNFIQPGLQMFVPEVALDLRENFRLRRVKREWSALLPAAQAMLLSCLYSGKTSEAHLTANALLGCLRYSRVTLSKAVEQFTSLSLIAPTQNGMSRKTYSFDGQPREVFSRIRPHLRSPVKKKIGISRNTLPMAPGVFMAGETALANYTMLAEPRHPVWGMTREVFNKMLELNAFRIVGSVDSIEEWIEIWAYPSLTVENHIADEASLLLSLEANPDERVKIALDELKGKIFWIPPTV